MKILNETRLIKQCQKGNKEAFNELIAFYYPFVSKFLIKTVGTKDLADDLTQETFIKMIRSIDKFNPKGTAAFSTYLIAAAKNCYIDYLRKNGREIQEADIESVSNTVSPEGEWLSRESYNSIMEKINRLPPGQREAKKLKYIEGYTLSEIAAFQKTEVKTIKSKLFEERKKLKKYLKGADEYE